MALIVVVVDAVTKRWASQEFVDGPVEVIDGILGFRYSENPGAAFSLFRDGGSLLALVAIGVIAFVLWMLRHERSRLELIGLGLVLGGAGGNLVDRIARGDGLFDGKVIDWIDFLGIPTFNLADTALTFAVVLLLIASWRST